MCVDKFPSSTTRPEIMTGLEKIIGELRKANVHGSLWIDGSFVTQKIDADDADVVLRVPVEFVDAATAEQVTVLRWIASDLKASHRIDGYLLVQFPEGHKHYWIGEYNYAYWLRQFGFSRGHDLKGLGVIQLS